VRCLGELQAAVLHERDSPGRQLYLQHVAVVRGPHEHGLLAQVQARLVRVEHPRADLARLGGLVMAAHQHRRLSAAAVGGQRQLQTRGLRPDHVRQPQHGSLRTVVPDQPDHRQVGVGSGQRAQMLRVGAAEAVHGLGVVTDAGEPVSVRREQPHDVGLHGVDVLVLIDEHRVEQAAQGRPGGGVRQRRAPEQQQVVEVDQPVPALVGDVVAEEPGELDGEVGAPGEVATYHVSYGLLGVHAPGVDVGAQRRSRGAPPGADQVVVRAQRVQHVRDVSRVDHAERGRQRERLRVRPDDPVRDGVKRSSADPLGRGHRRWRDPGEDVVGRPAGEGEQQDPAGLHPLTAQPGRPRHQRPGLARPGSGQHEQRPLAMRRRAALLGVQSFEPVRRFEHGHECSHAGSNRPVPSP